MRFVVPSYEIISCPNGQEIIQLAKDLAYIFCNDTTDIHDSTQVYTYPITPTIINAINAYTAEVKFISNHVFSNDIINTSNNIRCSTNKKVTDSSVSITPMQSKWLAMDNKPSTLRAMKLFTAAYDTSTTTFLKLVKMGVPIQVAKEILPIGLKSEIYIKTNLREWRQLLRLRCSDQAHPRMRQLMIPLLYDLHERIPYIFDDLVARYPIGQENEVQENANNS